MIPQHVIRHWRRSGKDEAWILERIQAYTDDWKKNRLKHRKPIPGKQRKPKQITKRHLLPDIDELLELYQKHTIKEISKKYDCSCELVRQKLSTHPDYKSHQRIKRRKLVGCDKCITDEYARGLCRNCYSRWLNHGKPKIDAVKPKMKPWEKKKTTVTKLL